MAIAVTGMSHGKANPADLLLEVPKTLTMVSRADLVGRSRRGKFGFVMNRKKSKEKIDFRYKSKNRNETPTLANPNPNRMEGE